MFPKKQMIPILGLSVFVLLLQTDLSFAQFYSTVPAQQGNSAQSENLTKPIFMIQPPEDAEFSVTKNSDGSKHLETTYETDVLMAIPGPGLGDTTTVKAPKVEDTNPQGKNLHDVTAPGQYVSSDSSVDYTNNGQSGSGQEFEFNGNPGRGLNHEKLQIQK